MVKTPCFSEEDNEEKKKNTYRVNFGNLETAESDNSKRSPVIACKHSHNEEHWCIGDL